jgi:hypothetical protein
MDPAIGVVGWVDHRQKSRKRVFATAALVVQMFVDQPAGAETLAHGRRRNLDVPATKRSIA